ncbi:MAG: hypothetical protein IKL35_04375 [Muribaculaceae bacterium]|nr:hypothetical protein [Muribaculaceae bacterium]
MKIIIEDIIKSIAPQLHVITIEADVINSKTPDEFWAELTDEAKHISSLYEISDINKRPGIAATRQAYKNLGKEPNRYRPSSEALCRRAVKGMELYRINTLVDIINLISMRSGYSIGGFDADKIDGDILNLGAGRAEEEFEAIGRGLLNIENLPIYRDNIGGIGTPTSDVERTKLSIETRRLLMCINIYGEELSHDETIALSCNLLKKYCNAQNIIINHYQP